MIRSILISSLLLTAGAAPLSADGGKRAAGKPPSVEKLQKLAEKIRGLKRGVVVKTAKKASASKARGVSKATAVRSLYRQMAAINFRSCLSADLPKEHRVLAASGLRRLSVAGEKAAWDPASLVDVEPDPAACGCPTGTSLIGTDAYDLCYCAQPETASTNKSSRPVSTRMERALSKLDPQIAVKPKSDPKVSAAVAARYRQALVFERMAAAATRPAFPAVPVGKDGKPDLSRVPTSSDLKPLAAKLASGQGPVYVMRALPHGRGYRSVAVPRSLAVRGVYRMMASLDYRDALLAGLPAAKARKAESGLWRIHNAAVSGRVAAVKSKARRAARKSRRSSKKAGVRFADDEGGDDSGGGDYNYSPPEDTSGGYEQPVYVPSQADDSSYQGASDEQSYSAPDETYSAPEETYTAPEETYDAPEETYTAPEDAYVAPEDAYTPPEVTYTPPDDNSDAFVAPSDGGDQTSTPPSDGGDETAATGNEDGGEPPAATGSEDGGDQPPASGGEDGGDQSNPPAGGDQLTPPMPTDNPPAPPADGENLTPPMPPNDPTLPPAPPDPPLNPLTGTPVTDPGTADPAPNGQSQYNQTWDPNAGAPAGGQTPPAAPDSGVAPQDSGPAAVDPNAVDPNAAGANAGTGDQAAGGTGDSSGVGGNTCFFGICNNATLSPDDADAWGGATGVPPELPLVPFPGQGSNPGPEDLGPAPVVDGGAEPAPAPAPTPVPDVTPEPVPADPGVPPVVPDQQATVAPDDSGDQTAVTPMPPVEIPDVSPAPEPPVKKPGNGYCAATDDGIVDCHVDPSGGTISGKFGKGGIRRRFSRALAICPKSSAAVHASRGAFAICAAPAPRTAKKSGGPRKSALAHKLARLDLTAKAVSKSLASGKAARAQTAALFLRRAQLYEGMAAAIRSKHAAARHAGRHAAAPHAAKAKSAPVQAKPVVAAPPPPPPAPAPAPAPEPPAEEAPAPPPVPKSDMDQMEDMEKQMRDEVQKRTGSGQ